ncbi:MAG: aldolase catalytic domain-containing protein [Candidatus Omnitrophica bacterium]|nr:aldolase catalytic domain-containing protein [Candidatus Omnitrophota bacterium]
MKKIRQIKILDCTIRDGGYLNGWAFDLPMVREVYRNVSKSGVDFIELGFRNTLLIDKNPWLCVSEDILHKIVSGIPGVPVSLMLDYGKFKSSDIPLASDSIVRMYRLAIHKKDIKDGMRYFSRLKSKGYRLSLQLMGINAYADKDFKELVLRLKNEDLDYLYFADSYGALFPANIPRIFNWLRETGKSIGYHPHNNLQLGFANSLTAIKEGADIIDATIYGMGRGAGNLPLEILVMFLEQINEHSRYNCIPLLDLIDRYFISLQKEFPWGYSLPYMLSGIFGLHPNYAKALIDRREYDMATISKFLEFIKEQEPEGFDKTKLDVLFKQGVWIPGARHRRFDKKEAQIVKHGREVTYLNRHPKCDFLILANGPTLAVYQPKIKKFIRKYNPIVIGVNFLDHLFIPDYHGFSNKKRFTQYIDMVSAESRLLLSSSFESGFIREYTPRTYETVFHLDRADTQIGIIDGVITTNCCTIGLLMASVAIVMGAKRIFIAGMDGYQNCPEKKTHTFHFYDEGEEAIDLSILAEKHSYNQKMMNSINQLLSDRGGEGLHIITPTSYGRFYTDINHWLKHV